MRLDADSGADGVAGVREPPPVVQLTHVVCAGAAADAGGPLEASLAVAAGELVLLRTPQPSQGSLLANLCTGVATPATGSVRFLGLDWTTLDDDEMNALRALIGRVFYRGGWLEHLSVADNVLLPLLHHTREPRQRLLDAAALMAREFGLPGLPTVEPARCAPGELQRAACVRAFLGSPRLVLLEHPAAGLYPQLMPALVGAIRRACNRGAAVLWMTRSQPVWRDAWLPVTRRLRMAGRVLLVAGGGR